MKELKKVKKNKEKNKKTKLFTQLLGLDILETDLEEKQKILLKKTPEEDKVVYLGTHPEHPRDRFRRKVKDRLRKEAEDEVVYLSTRPRRPRDRFRDRVKDKKWHK